MKAKYSLRAGREITEALNYYESQSNEAALNFLEELEETIAIIRIHPLIGRQISPRLRRLGMPELPYLIYYKAQGKEIWIASVFHTSRIPERWQGH